ncbi:MAG: hypothetical protein GOMPHAMPRED_004637 [Gomphillus americanus]|uniref:Myb-like DNA-binding domain-containing protein n=1 Tax=Gomphillus americanus TaxID=1940652 RepID=A0A8H3FP81_9LECA|nr:MAG: hypothetical protein GOMPHAMPRED_004637 [Gomphillus americanus]
MATSLRRSPGGPESTTVKFLFAVIKQLETKAINWQLVADEIKITNGHAARMRFSRLKAQVEGSPPYGKANKNCADGIVRKKRKTDIRTERKRAAERAAAEAAARANGQTEGMTVKMEAADVDADAHADDERDYPLSSNAVEPNGYAENSSRMFNTVEPERHEGNLATSFTCIEPSGHEEVFFKMETGLESDFVMG